MRLLRQTGCSPSFEDSGVLNARESSSLLAQVGADEDDRLRRGRHRNRKTTPASITHSMDLLHLVTAVVAFLGTIIKRWHHKQMAHVLWQPRCLEVASRRHHVAGVDETRRTYRHDGRQRDAPRRIATFHHATLRVATHRYATLEPLGKPGGSRAFSPDGPPQSPGAPRRLPQPAGG
jgi:hypothetical protein